MNGFIGELIPLAKVVVQPRQQEIIKKTINNTRDKSYKGFVIALSELSKHQRGNIEFGKLEALWKHFPRKEELDGKVGNSTEPGDGIIYEEKTIMEARSVLKAFYQAWSNTAGQAEPTPLEPKKKIGKIQNMGKICLVLSGMSQARLLDDFLLSEVDDENLPLLPEVLEKTLHRDHQHLIETFLTEQYRAVRRPWKDGEHIDLRDEEPMPFKHEIDYRKGSYASVSKVKDVCSNMLYARKESIDRAAHNHLKREARQLKRLRHPHIVEFVKSYRRGDQYGILLSPAATTDLQRLLGRYHKNSWNHDNPDRRRRDRDVLEPVLLTAFGCLSRGLAHIHARFIRHKDIKPANILYEKITKPRPGTRFLWADFGLAYDFSTKDNSKTRTELRYSKRYAAPEIVEGGNSADTRDSRPESSNMRGSFDEASSEAHERPADESPSAQTTEHGRKSDMFSFGCTVLEILSVLVGEGIADTDHPGEFQQCGDFSKNIDKLHQWAGKKLKALHKDSPLHLLFRLGIEMTHFDPEKRPDIWMVVRKLKKSGDKRYFCPTCLADPDGDDEPYDVGATPVLEPKAEEEGLFEEAGAASGHTATHESVNHHITQVPGATNNKFHAQQPSSYEGLLIAQQERRSPPPGPRPPPPVRSSMSNASSWAKSPGPKRTIRFDEGPNEEIG